MNKGVDKHLDIRNIYKLLTKTVARKQISVTKYLINILIAKYREDISPT